MKKILLCVLILFISGMTVFAGGSSESNSVSADGKVQLNFYAWTEGDYLQDIVDLYNSQSDVAEVTLISFPSEDYDTKLMTMLSGRNDIDVYTMRSISQMNTLADAGKLVDLSSYIQSAELDISAYGTSFAGLAVDGKYYALPYRSQSYALFYNKKIFDERGLEYPDNLTWEEYADLALELTQGEGVNKFYGGFIPDWLYAPFITQQMGSNIADDDLGPTQAWLEMLNRLYNIDNSHMSFADMKSTGADYINYLCTGKTAMAPNGEWMLSDISTFLKNNPGLEDTFELGIAVLPQVEETNDPVTLGGVSTFVGINSTSDKQDAAFDFVRFLTGEESASIIASYGMLPAYISDETVATYTQAVGSEDAANLLDVNKVFEGLFFPEFSQIQTAYQEEKELYLIGEQTIEETMENFRQIRAEIMNK